MGEEKKKSKPKEKEITNIEKLKTLETNEMAKFLGNEIYNIFRYSLTKREFMEKLAQWLNSKVEIKDEKKNDKLYDYDVRA